MQNWKSWFKTKVLPHVVILAVFAGVSAAFFAPQFDGGSLRQGDMVRAAGMGRDIREHIEKYGEHPQWAGNMFGGMPAYMIDMNYDGRLVKEVGDAMYFPGEPAGWIFVAMAGFYLMLLLFGVNPWLSMIGGLGYGLSSYFIIIIGAGHITKMLALAWVAPMVGAVWYAYRRRMWLGAALAGLFAAIVIATSHLQIPYYFLFVLLALAVNEFVRAYKERALAKFARVSGVLLLSGALAAGANSVQLYYVADHADDTIRGRSELSEFSGLVDAAGQTSGLDKDYATEWSYGKSETFNLLVPNLYGGGSDFSEEGEVSATLSQYRIPEEYAQYIPSYWGPQRFTEGPVYIGAVLIFLMVLALFVLRGRDKWWIAAVSVLALFLAWGRHMMWFTDLFLDYFPMYNKFRTVSMILVIVEWSVPLLAILGLQQIESRKVEREKLFNGLKWSVIVVGGLCLLIGLLGLVLDTSVFGKGGEEETIARLFGFERYMGDASAQKMVADIVRAMQVERAELMTSDGFRSFGFVLLAGGLVWLWASRSGKGGVKGVRNALFTAGMAGLVLVDLFGVDKRYVSSEDFSVGKSLAVPMTESDRQILRDTSDYRVANFTVDPFVDQTNATAYYHRSVGGYHAAKLRRYDELITHHLAKSNRAVYDMLNVKYFIVPGEDGKPAVEVNPRVCGSAWYVQDIQWVTSPDEELAALGGDFDPHTTAVADSSKFAGITMPEADTTAKIQLTEYRVNRLTYRTRAEKDGAVVFSEIYYPKGWTAYLDGERVDYFRANYVLRAMRVPAGEHEIVFSFAAPHFTALVWVTRICSLILLCGALGIIVALTVKVWHRQEA